ncbi:MAG TPA: Fe-S cluster assembly protein SufD [Bacteroidales bacterium]|nr:Fe-S cluster assembly protein SufD [Bacteroidales bacterium]
MNGSRKNMPDKMSSIDNIQLKGQLEELFKSNFEKITRHDFPGLPGNRENAVRIFSELGFPDRKMENWRYTDLRKVLGGKYHTIFEPENTEISIEQVFKCNIHELETDQISLLNGWYVDSRKPLVEYDNGVIAGSLAAAMKKHPEIFEKHYGKYAETDKDGFHALNLAFAQDGFFIYVPDNIVVEKPMQMVSIINWDQGLFIQTRNLVILGRNSKLTMVHCDDSTNQEAMFKNSVTEVFIDEGANLEHYKLQNLNNQSALINNTWFRQMKASSLKSNAITLNGGLIRNYTHTVLDGEGASAEIFGVYLMDSTQHVDNQVFVDHASPNCFSNELFKGILDEEATAVFNGHILVRRDAQKTNAFQNNKNILMSDTAKANSKPFLEIYADDVKCSHGATVGQLDPEAMFYLRSRGICEANARLLLLYAFAGEIVDKVSIQALKARVDDMIRKRLKGELHICETCALHCEGPNKEILFEIDMSKV